MSNMTTWMASYRLFRAVHPNFTVGRNFLPLSKILSRHRGGFWCEGANVSLTVSIFESCQKFVAQPAHINLVKADRLSCAYRITRRSLRAADPLISCRVIQALQAIVNSYGLPTFQQVLCFITRKMVLLRI